MAWRSVSFRRVDNFRDGSSWAGAIWDAAGIILMRNLARTPAKLLRRSGAARPQADAALGRTSKVPTGFTDYPAAGPPLVQRRHVETQRQVR